MIENLVSGKKYRICTDESRDTWDRVSFWTKASDVQNDDGTTAENTATKAQQALYEAYNRILKVSVKYEIHEYDYSNLYLLDRPRHDLFYWCSQNSSTTGAINSDGVNLSAGMWMWTTTPVTRGTQIIPGVNCERYPMTNWFENTKVYVGGDGKLHYQDYRGADTALNFSGRPKVGYFKAMLVSANCSGLRADLYQLPTNTGFKFTGMRTDIQKQITIRNQNDTLIYDSGLTYAKEIVFDKTYPHSGNYFDAFIDIMAVYNTVGTGDSLDVWYELLTL